MYKEIPLSGGIENGFIEFSVVLNQINYDMTLMYRPVLNCWSLSISRDGEALARGVRLVMGANLMQSYSDQFIRDRNKGDLFGELYVAGNEPTLHNLGVSSKLIWGFNE